LWPQHESSGGGTALFVENAATTTTTEATEQASKQGRIGERVEKCAIKLLGFSFIYFFLSSLGGSFKIGFDDEIDNSNHPCTCTLGWCAYHGVEEHSASPRNKLSRVAKLWGRGGIITSRRTTSYSSDIQALQ
jgi:hypothetical protein